MTREESCSLETVAACGDSKSNHLVGSKNTIKKKNKSMKVPNNLSIVSKNNSVDMPDVNSNKNYKSVADDNVITNNMNNKKVIDSFSNLNCPTITFYTEKSSIVTNKQLSKPTKSMSFIANGLTKIRDVEDFEDDFPIEEFNYFIETIPSHNSEGKFRDAANIPSKLISNARKAFLKSRPNATENELQQHLTYKFYGNKAFFDEETSFLLNQCLRTGSRCFNSTKEYVIQNGYNIKMNEFFKFHLPEIV